MIYLNNNIKFEVQSSNNSDELFSKLFWVEGYSIRGEWECKYPFFQTVL